MSNHRQDGTRVPKFPLGRVFATPGALELMREMQTEPAHLLARHQYGDWGDMPPEDAAENERSVTENLRVLSSYLLQPPPDCSSRRHLTLLWIITEADRSSTTLLLPEEY
ncbi:MAG: Type restriction-modification system methyltransferase subunit [Ramlibacter sp.]|nr:Type restriction-modification system methyltransferase subunit [Ramlibacter sp.]